MDIIRKIVLAVADAQGALNSVDGVSKDEFACHVQLLEEAGLVMAAIQGQGKQVAKAATIFRLTWAGQDFADSITNDTLWKKAKENVIKPSASWTFGILLDYLGFEIRSGIPGLKQFL